MSLNFKTQWWVIFSGWQVCCKPVTNCTACLAECKHSDYLEWQLRWLNLPSIHFLLLIWDHVMSYCQQCGPISYCSCAETKWATTMGQTSHSPAAPLTGNACRVWQTPIQIRISLRRLRTGPVVRDQDENCFVPLESKFWLMDKLSFQPNLA